MERKDGGPAFPITDVHDQYDNDLERWRIESSVHSGMSLRDYFAAAALPEMTRRFGDTGTAASYAYEAADAMLAEREK